MPSYPYSTKRKYVRKTQGSYKGVPRLSTPGLIDERCAQLKARLERERNQPEQEIKIPRTRQLPKGHSIIQELAHLSFHSWERVKQDLIAVAMAKKHHITVRHVYRLLAMYERSHTLDFSKFGAISSHWAKIVEVAEVGVVGNGNRRVSPREKML